MSRQVIPQFELGPRVGGIKEIATRLSFYNGIANSLMVAALYYGQNPVIPGVGVRLQTLAPTILAFYGVLLVCAAVIAVFEHSLVVRAQAEYNQVQEFGEGVSPIRRHLRRVEESTEDRFDDIESQLADIQQSVDDQ